MPEGDDDRPRRALVLAGGGAKCAYQAGVLQVWLDEARLDGRRVEFEFADGASGGVFNLALWCQGKTGREIADAWRDHQPLLAATPNPWLLALRLRPSVFTGAGIRDRMLPRFGIDPARIRRGPDDTGARDGRFSVWDVTGQELRSVPAAEATPELLLAAVSPPVWFPPVRHDGRTYTDAVFATDADLVTVLEAGATELWLVWTVNTRGRWRDGWSRAYFNLLETAANSRLKSDLDRIRKHNHAVRTWGRGEFGTHPVDVRLLRREVPVTYLLDWRRSHLRRVVELGVRDARAWCVEQGIPVEPTPPAGPAPEPADVLFRETMAGRLSFGSAHPDRTVDGGEVAVSLALTVTIRDVDRFVRDPDHPATVSGVVRSEAWLGACRVEEGGLRLLVDDGDGEKLMRYELLFRDPAGRLLRLVGTKTLHRDGWFDSWPDTTTLATTVTWLRDDDGASPGEPVAAGELRLTVAGFLRQLLTLRAFAPTLPGRVGALARFGGFFAGGLLDVYARRRPRPVPPPEWLTRGVRP